MSCEYALDFVSGSDTTCTLPLFIKLATTTTKIGKKKGQGMEYKVFFSVL